MCPFLSLTWWDVLISLSSLETWFVIVVREVSEDSSTKDIHVHVACRCSMLAQTDSCNV